MNRARYICIEGTEGVGKTTQVDQLTRYLRKNGYKVLQTKEPGTDNSPLTMELRSMMLDIQYDYEMTPEAREFISQAIRSIHLDTVVAPVLPEYDFIVQDRGILSGFAYGIACGNDISFLKTLAQNATHNLHRDFFDGEKARDTFNIYDDVIYLKNDDVKESLNNALDAKQEFESGDAMESRGADFINEVRHTMDAMSTWFNTKEINVGNKDKDQTFQEIKRLLGV